VLLLTAFVLSILCLSHAQVGFDSGTKGILEEFYIALDGPGWDNATNWLSPNISYCQWFGVICAPNSTSVVELTLDNNGLNGQMKFSIGNLRDLQRISLARNDILGRLPPTLSRCTQLHYLNFSDNLIDSVIPVEFGAFHRLVTLDLSKNLISGELPEELVDLEDLTYLNLAENNLVGAIPEEYAHLSSLVYMNISHNKLQHWIPELGSNLTNLVTLDLSNNELDGMIPESLQSIPNLENIILANNEIKVIEEFHHFDELHCDFSGNPFACPMSELAHHCGAVCTRPTKQIPGIAVVSVFAMVGALIAAIVFVVIVERERIREDSGIVDEPSEDDF